MPSTKGGCSEFRGASPAVPSPTIIRFEVCKAIVCESRTSRIDYLKGESAWGTNDRESSIDRNAATIFSVAGEIIANAALVCYFSVKTIDFHVWFIIAKVAVGYEQYLQGSLLN